MNLFNCFQAVAFYTLSPVLIQWLFTNGFNVWAWVASAAMAIGYITITLAVHETNWKW